MLIAALTQTGNLSFEAKPFDLKLPDGIEAVFELQRTQDLSDD